MTVSIPDVPDASARLLAEILAWLGPLPPWAGSAVERAGELPLAALLVAWLWLWALARRAPVGALTAVLAVPAGCALAWLASESAKRALRVERPCRLLPSFPDWADCAAEGDWSLPSNHAAVAGALAVGVSVAAWRLGRPAVCAVAPIAGACAAGSRVLAGAHFPHDVAVGVVLGGIVAVVPLLLVDRLAPRPLGHLRARRRAGFVVGPAPTPGAGPDR